MVADSGYSQREFIGEQVKQDNLVVITRVRSDRVFYRQFIPDPDSPKKSGHPRWYGDKFDLKDATTWHLEDEVFQSNLITKKGRIKGYKKASRTRDEVIKKAHRPCRGFRARKDGARNEKSCEPKSKSLLAFLKKILILSISRLFSGLR